MAESAGLADRIKEEYIAILREYMAFDRTLDALAAFRFLTTDVIEIERETDLVDFQPRLEPAEPDTQPYTPDALIINRRQYDFVLELKASWNEKDARQVTKYGKSVAYSVRDETKRAFKPNRCLLLGYQNPPGESRLDEIFHAWQSEGLGDPLVVFRYSLEPGTEGDRIYISRVPYKGNGECPTSSLGRSINSPRGLPIPTDNYKMYRAKFHKANDQVIASYAAVIWWSKYAIHYLSEDQRSEMAERGRLTSPLLIKLDRVDDVRTPPDVEIPLGPKDVRRALEFLAQAGLVTLKKKGGVFEVQLKEDRLIRLPRNSPVSRDDAQLDISKKIIVRWATTKVKKPAKSGRPRKSRTRRGRDTKTLPLF